MYPLWDVPGLTAGLILGLTAAVHILPSHFSTSAMWFNVFIETKAYRENRPELLEFIKKYSLLLLVFSYVFGSLTGIGIWYSATVANPRGISGLIHNYVWGWATEWVFFIIEVTGILVYYYTLGKVDRKTHLKIGWVFAAASWTTMVIIVGILSFMLSPGKWPETGGFFDGFFNQTYWFQLLTRTCGMFAIAGIYAIAVAATLKNDEIKRLISRTASLWGMGGLTLAAVMLFLWDRFAMPDAAKTVLSMPFAQGLKPWMIGIFGVIFFYFLFNAVKPGKMKVVPAAFMVLVLFAGIWTFERQREMARKPYVIAEYMYSNQLIAHDIPAKGVKADSERINEAGILKIAPFVPEGIKEVTEQNILEAGKMVALLECGSCHAFTGKGIRPLPQMFKRLGFAPQGDRDKEIGEYEVFLDAIGGYPYMPAFMGTPAEKKALATYLHSISQTR